MYILLNMMYNAMWEYVWVLTYAANKCDPAFAVRHNLCYIQ